MKIVANVKMVYEVDPGDYCYNHPDGPRASILEAEETSIMAKVARIPRFLLPRDCDISIEVNEG